MKPTIETLTDQITTLKLEIAKDMRTLTSLANIQNNSLIKVEKDSKQKIRQQYYDLERKVKANRKRIETLETELEDMRPRKATQSEMNFKR